MGDISGHRVNSVWMDRKERYNFAGRTHPVHIAWSVCLVGYSVSIED